MASIAHSDWMFEHSLVHHFDTPVDFHPDTSADLSHVTQTDSVASVLQTLWHHTDLMNGGSSSAQSASNASAAVGSGKGSLPTLTVTNTAITVNAGGSIALPITASPSSGHDSSVTISGLTSYESLTDSLDHKIFTGDSITLSAAEVDSGLSLASDYTGTGHPVNTLTVTASETLGHHTLTSAPQTIVVTDPPVSTSSTGGATTNGLTLQVSGDNLKGTDPQIEVFVDGTQIGGTYTITADHASGQTQTLQIAGNFDPTVAHQVQVKFINDAWDGQTGDGNDINAYVESISLNGTSIAGAQGMNTAANGAVNAANASEAVMDIDGTLTFSVAAAPPPPAATNGLTLVVSGDNLHGTDPQIEVFVDGKQIGSTYTITADHASGQTQTLQIAGNFDPTVAHQVQVKFINDAWDGQTGDGNDINAYVESISLNGTSIAGAQGTNNAANGAVNAANASEAVMDIDGTLTFSVPVAPPPPAKGLTLVVTGDNMQGTDPEIEVFVDGTQIGSTYTITADHASGQTQTLQIAGNFDPTVAHQVQVKFINDAWDGKSGDGNDINAYVESISLNGTSIAGAQGTNTAANGAVNAANANEAVMDIDGTLTFNVPGTGTSGSGTSTGGSGTAAVATVGTGAGAPPSGAGFFVSPTGNDSNPGTLAAPFATLTHAQQAMENSSIKVTYVEGGTYHLTSALDLTAADNGETWQYYPPNGVDSAVLDGGGATDLIFLDGSSNVTINGLSLQHASSSAITTQDGAGAAQITGITIENCDIGFNQHTGAQGGFNPLVLLENVTNSHIENNYVHDGASQGIGLYAFYSGQSINGDVVSGNVVLNTVQQMSDGGAIYLNMRGTGGNGGDVTIANNFVENYGASGITGACGIYLDDNTSNVTVTGNVVAPPTEGAVSTGNDGAAGVEIHDGLNNHISGNIIDLGDSGRTLTALWFQDSASLAGMAGNTFTGNVVISNFTGNQNTNDTGQSGFTYFENSPSSDFTIANNVYFNEAGGQVRTDGPTASDSNPILENPAISGSTYQIASGSAVFGSPVNFASIVGGWGPAGFVIPQTATVSSDQ
jgi:hypothetical protein